MLAVVEYHHRPALATFAAGASLPAVESVLEALAVPRAAAIDVVGRLASRSLVIVDAGGGPWTPRYRLLDSIRAFALEAMALSAALLAPIAIGVGRLASTPAMRVAVRIGIAAAAVQVVGLLRWPILVPGYASDAASGDAAVAAGARDSFSTANDILGTAIGETLGYLLTATWTVLVIVALGRRFAGRWFRVLGVVSATLVLVGVLSPFDLPVVDTANFVGYVLWSIWLIAFGVVILLRERRVTSAPSSPARAVVSS